MNSSASGLLARWRVRRGWTHQATAWLIFGPPAVMLGVRWLLQLSIDRAGGVPALPLAPVATAAGMTDLLWPALWGCAVLIGLAGLIRRWGWRRVMPVAGVVWLMLWLGGSAMLVQRQLNREGLWLQEAVVPLKPTVMAHVLSRQLKAPSLRSLGGTELVLSVPGVALPQRLLLQEASAQGLKTGDTVALQLASGRFSGSFVTAWQAQPAASP